MRNPDTDSQERTKHTGSATPQRRFGPKSYLLSGIVALILAGYSSTRLYPVFLVLFVSYPQLNAATKISGTLEIVGEVRIRAPRRYFFDNGTGRAEVWCGLPTDRDDCFAGIRSGSKGDAWLHPVFGVMQYELVLPDGRAAASSYLEHRRFYETQLADLRRSDYQGRFIPVLLWLGCAAYCLSKYRRLKSADFTKD